MDYHCCSLILTSLLIISFSTADDAAIMAKLSKSISPTPSTWHGNNFCKWEGIACDSYPDVHFVAAIDLSFRSLTGTLPSDINSLRSLRTLAMQGNSLSGPLPTLSNLASLEQVILDGNNFTSIPSDLFYGLNSLRSFSISDNLQLSPWSLPNDLINSTHLRTFQANQANIYGTIPDIFDSLLYLQNLRLSYNNLTGTLDVLSSMTQISQVWLEANAFTGAIPDLSKCIVLFDLQLRDNQLTGLVPHTLMSLTNLANITLQNNKLQGPVPVFGLGVTVELGANSFCLDKPGKCDAQVTTLLEVAGSLGYPMSLAESWLGDDACDGWEFVVCNSNNSVTSVNFAKQNFSGTISPAFGNLTSLRMLLLNDNNLTGSIPEVLTSLPDLELLDVSNNNLSGLVPVFPTRVKFSSDNNLLLGKPIPKENINPTDSKSSSGGSFCLDKPEKCDAQVTALLEVAGTLGYPMSLAESWLGDDACDGWEFVVCNSNNSVTSVNFAKQNFSGTISPAFGNLNSLTMLLLNDNNLTGSIPEVLTSLPDLQLLDVSNNNLSGLVPVFPTRVKFSSDNNLLLGKPIPNENINPTDSKSSSGGSVGFVIGIVISGVIFVIGAVLFVSYKCYRVSPSKLQSEISVDHSEEIPSSESGNVMMISIQMLQQATDDFSDEKVLGNGGFGVVYKGELDDGTKIAVKRRKSGVNATKWMNEFLAEIKVLTKVRHKHLVALLGYCIDGNESLLVYEYMAQGSLSQHLFKCGENESPPLSWKQRVSIALDVGRGVEYLHSMAQQSFIHRDLKPANILLGDDMRAKVADFGLVKITPDGKYSVSTRVAGTFGYVAPEYSATGRVTSKVDVYSFGVVLMQLITGRKALDETMPYESCQLATWFRRVPVTKKNMVKYVDKALDTNDNETLESIFKVAELAKHCTAVEPFHRPDMGYVGSVLRPLLEQWRPLPQEQEKTYYRRHVSLPLALQADEDTSSSLDIFQPNSF